MLTEDSLNSELTAHQEIMAKLRESFLRAINEFHDEPINILTYELSRLQAKFSEWKSDGSEVLVKDLETPAQIKMSTALLRSSDILVIQFERPLELP